MKKLLSFFSLENSREKIGNTLKRFPLSTVILLCIFCIFLYINNFQEYARVNQDIFLKMIFTLITMFFLSAGLYLFSESKKYTPIKTYLLQVLTILFGTSFYLFFGNNFDYQNIIFFIIATFGICCFLFYAAFTGELFIKKDGDLNQEKKDHYFSYIGEMFGAFITAFSLGLISAFLGFIAINATISLFDLYNLNTGKWIGNWFIIACSLFAPFYGLSKLPQKEEIEVEVFSHKISRFFMEYIALPFIAIFFIILYAYSLKVLINFDSWPKGEVSWLVIAFSIFAYAIYIGSYNLEKISSKFKKFRTLIPYIVIPQIFMLFYAIYIRIANYGLTINRYLVVIFGIWLFIVSLYFIFSKRKFLAVIPFILSVFSIIISIGPWSIYHYPQKTQFDLLKKHLQETNILQSNGEIVPLTDTANISSDNIKNIESKIRYLCDYNDCKYIQELFPEQYTEINTKEREEFEKRKKENIKRYEEAMKENKGNNEERYENNKGLLEKEQKSIYHGPGKWNITNYIIDELKIRKSYNQDYVSFYNQDIYPLNISGYSKIYRFPNEKVKISNNFLTFDETRRIPLPFDLKEEIKQQRYEKEITFTFEYQEKRYHLIITSANISENIEATREEGVSVKEIIFEDIFIEGLILEGEK